MWSILIFSNGMVSSMKVLCNRLAAGDVVASGEVVKKVERVNMGRSNKAYVTLEKNGATRIALWGWGSTIFLKK